MHGKGPPCDRWLDELAGLLSAWGGRLALGATPADDIFVLASLAPERQAAMSPVLRYRLGLDATLNMAFNEVFGANP